MSEQEYNKAVDQACQEAGGNDGYWNTRFIVELANKGLRLVPISDPVFESTYYMQAPNPVEHELPTWSAAKIVPLQ